MKYLKYCKELNLIAEKELEEGIRLLPTDPVQRFILFTETIRVMDYYGVGGKTMHKDEPVPLQLFEIARMGWNVVASHLFKGLSTVGFPCQESTMESRQHSFYILYKFGCVVLIQRVVEMVKSGFLKVRKNKDQLTFKKINPRDSQGLDNFEFTIYETLANEIDNLEEDMFNGWKLEAHQDFDRFRYQPGYYLSRRYKPDLPHLEMLDVDSMVPLVHPLDTGSGIMMIYSATQHIDGHFLLEATKYVQHWARDAGFPYETKLNDVPGKDIIAIVTVIVGLHLKHVGFAEIAARHHPTVNIPQSLTLWQPLEKLKDLLAFYTGFDLTTVSNVLNVIMMNAIDAEALRKHSTNFMPLIIDIGNGLVLQPVSSLTTNPFFSIITLLENRDDKNRDKLSRPREEWLRESIYATLEGTRFERIEGNVKLRDGHRIVTDIDAAVYDYVTGELALFQLKWQDFFTNDVRKLRSKASNLAHELDLWSGRTTDWISTNGVDQLLRNLRLKLDKTNISKIFMFGISRNLARTQGYGYQIKSDNLAVANWPQFLRNRLSILPGENVFNHLFEAVRKQFDDTLESTPLQTSLRIAGKKLKFKDLWCLTVASKARNRK